MVPFPGAASAATQRSVPIAASTIGTGTEGAPGQDARKAGPMPTRLAATILLIVALVAACAAPAGESTPGAAEPTAEPTPAVTAEPTPAVTAESMPAASETAGELALPEDVTLTSIADFEPVTGVAHFNQLTDDAFNISIDVESGEATTRTDFNALLLAGTCASQTEPADFDGALKVQSFEGAETGGGTALLLSGDELDGVLGAPHSILVTDGPGLNNLACGEIEG